MSSMISYYSEAASDLGVEFQSQCLGNSLVVQWLGLCAFMALVPSLIPGWGTKIPQAVWGGQQNNKRKPSAQVTNHIQLKLLLNCPLEKYHIHD